MASFSFKLKLKEAMIYYCLQLKQNNYFASKLRPLLTPLARIRIFNSPFVTVILFNDIRGVYSTAAASTTIIVFYFSRFQYNFI